MATVRIIVTAVTAGARAAFSAVSGALSRLAAHVRAMSTRIGAAGSAGWTRFRTSAASVFRSITTGAGRMASSIGTTLSSALTKTGPHLAVVGAVIGAMLGAAINGALLAAISGGVLAAGIAVALKNDAALRGVFGDIFKGMGSDLADAAQVFVGPLMRVAAIMRTEWAGKVGPALRQAFADVAPHVEQLGAALVGMVTNMLPGLNKLTANSGPALERLGEMFLEVGDAMSSFFESLNSGRDGAMKGLVVITTILSGTIRGLGNAIEFASKYFDAMTKFAEMVATAFGKIDPRAKAVADAIKDFNDSAENTSSITPLFTKGLDAVGYASKAAAQAAAELNGEMDEMFGGMTSGVDAALRYEEAIDALAESVRENGRATDISTAAGRENVKAVEEIARAAYAAREAAIAMAGGENASKQAVDAANATFAQQVAALRAMLTQMGFTKAQIDGLLGAWQNLAAQPNINKSVTVTTTYRGSLSEAVAGRAGGGPRFNASGGHPRGLSWVGENGPELVDFGATARVYSAGQSARMAQQATAGGGGQGGVLRVVFEAAAGTNDWLTEAFMNALRNGRIKAKIDNAGRLLPA